MYIFREQKLLPIATGYWPSAAYAATSYSGSRYKCKQIGSWAKAQELLKQGHSYLDRDGDGEACKSLR
ncbi:excalibur calcium-binding domain-containing protein [Synechococcus sp. UW140]|uniref:excalibur calcium-binding domain-containing protein n=1 Tax=Synechococcus sp. UW140 TaxID=368503 RepID=UPI003137ABB5